MAAEPVGVLDPRYSSRDAAPVPWARVRDRIADAPLYWLSTVRPDGRPHVTPLIGVWFDDALFFTTGAEERKARNLSGHPQVALTTGDNALHDGLDVVVEGDAVRQTDETLLAGVARAYEAKYGAEWHFDVADGTLVGDGGPALAFRVDPVTVFGFGKGEYTQTRWRFDRD